MRGRSPRCVALALAVALAASGGCFEVSCGGRNPERASALIDEGWMLYAQSRFDDARDRFTRAADMAARGGRNDLLGRARNGEGWSRLRLHDLDASVLAFDEAVNLGADGADPLAGRAGAKLAADDARGARADARTARALEPAWLSFHDPLDERALLAVALLGSLRLGDLPSAQEDLDRLDPANGLDPADPSSWVVGGVVVPTYPAAVLRASEDALR